MLVKDIAQAILRDPQFVKDVKLSLDRILKDGKIDMSDVPEMVLLVTLGYNKSKDFTVTITELPELLTTIANLLITKYNLVPEELKDQFNKILQSSITLILLNPKVQNLCASCLPCCK